MLSFELASISLCLSCLVLILAECAREVSWTLYWSRVDLFTLLSSLLFPKLLVIVEIIPPSCSITDYVT